MKITNISKPAYHRNGICGEPFQVATFEMKENGEPPRKMVAIRFADNKDSDGFAAPRIAVFDIALLYEGIIEMGENSWRGDHFADELDNVFTINKSDESLT